MSIYSLRMAQPRGPWHVPETQSSRNKERTKRVGLMALPIISALGALFTLTLSIAIPIVIGIVIGAIYFSRKNPEPTAPEAPPAYSADEAAAPSQRASSEAPPPYPNESGANPTYSFWDRSEYHSKNENQVSQSEVSDRLLNYYSTDGSSVSLIFRLPAKATAFLQYVDQMTHFSKIGTYKRVEEIGVSTITFTPFPAEQQPNKQKLLCRDVLACLRNSL